jgi:hypothetical protein
MEFGKPYCPPAALALKSSTLHKSDNVIANSSVPVSHSEIAKNEYFEPHKSASLCIQEETLDTPIRAMGYLTAALQTVKKNRQLYKG